MHEAIAFVFWLGAAIMALLLLAFGAETYFGMAWYDYPALLFVVGIAAYYGLGKAEGEL